MNRQLSLNIGRLRATLQNDALLQLRNRFYHATAFVLVVMAAVLFAVPTAQNRLSWLVPAVVLNNLIMTAFYFMAALVLLEKTDGTLLARAVTPLHRGEYLCSKIGTLTMIALLHNGVLALLITGFQLNPVLLIAGIGFASALFVLVGWMAALRFRSLSSFLPPSLLIAGLLMMPIVPYTLGWNSPLAYLHPLQAPLDLLRGAVQPLPFWRLALDALLSMGWLALFFHLATRDVKEEV